MNSYMNQVLFVVAVSFVFWQGEYLFLCMIFCVCLYLKLFERKFSFTRRLNFFFVGSKSRSDIIDGRIFRKHFCPISKIVI